MGRKVSIDSDGYVIYPDEVKVEMISVRCSLNSDENGMVELEEWTEALIDKDLGEKDD